MRSSGVAPGSVAAAFDGALARASGEDTFSAFFIGDARAMTSRRNISLLKFSIPAFSSAVGGGPAVAVEPVAGGAVAVEPVARRSSAHFGFDRQYGNIDAFSGALTYAKALRTSP